MHFVSKSPSIKLKTLHAGNEKIEKKKQRQIDPLMMDARKKEEILSPPFDALSYAAIMKVETANC